MRRTALVVFAFGFSAPLVAQTEESHTAPLSVCELVKNPMAYHGRLVQVRGKIHPAIIDTPVSLNDSTCARNLRLDVQQHRSAAHNAQGDRDFRRYLGELRWVEATVTGRFDMMLVPSREPHLSLTVSRVRDVVPGEPVLRLLRKRK